MALINQTVCWRPGTLRAFESISSVGAKYCYLNKVKAQEFYTLILELNGKAESLNRNDFTFNHPDFAFSKLSRLLHEPLSLVTKLTLSSIDSLPKLQTKTGYKLTYKDHFSYCPICLANGYHSVLHQVNWVVNCFIHQVPLINTLPYDIAQIHSKKALTELNLLYKIWFSESNTWRSSKTHNWQLLDSKAVEKSGKKFISALINIEDNLNNESIVLGENILSNFLFQVEHTSKPEPAFKSLFPDMNMQCTKPISYICGLDEANLLLNLDAEIYDLFMYTRQVLWDTKIFPKWKTILDDLPKTLFESHTLCLKEYLLTLQKFQKIGWCRGYSNIISPFNLENYEQFPCERIVTINLVKYLWNIERCLIHSSRDIYYEFGFDNINQYFNELKVTDQLVEANLAENIIRIIPREEYQLINKYFYIENINHEVKRIIAKIPLGIFEKIIDELLLAHIESWIWALFNTELHRNDLTNLNVTSEEYLLMQIKKLSPSAILEKTKEGIQLKIGKMVSPELPNWEINEANSHTTTVSLKFQKHRTTYQKITSQ